MKKYWMSVLTLASSVAILAYDPLSINQQTERIYHRFYIISRLEKTITTILHASVLERHLCCNILNETFFTHPEIQKTVRTIVQEKNIRPITTLWHQFKTYRAINDDTFEQEFVHLILMICYDIDQNQAARKKEVMIKQASTDDIAQTFYIINRLKKPFEILFSTYEQDDDLFSDEEIMRSQHSGFFDEANTLKHDRVQHCIEDIRETKSLTPLKKAHTEVKQYRFAGDDTFLKEQLSLLFFAYKLMLNKKLSNKTEQVIMHEMDTIQYITQNIEEFSIDQILSSIDLMTDKLSTINSLETKSNSSFSSSHLAIIPAAIAITGGALYMAGKLS